MAQPPAALLRTIRTIDAFTERTGQLFAWMIVPLVGGLTYEVVARYGFEAPTIWAFDLTYMLYGSHFMLGAAWALLKGTHIRTDMLWEKYSDRKKGLIDAIAYVCFFFPAILFVLLASYESAWHSFRIWELSEQTAWRPPIWPFKMVVPLTALLLLVQGVSEFLKSVWAAKTGTFLTKAEIIQI